MTLEQILERLKGGMEEAEYAEAEGMLTGMARKSADDDEYRSAAEARMREYADSEAAMKADIQSLKARNYDLLMQVPAENAGEAEADGVVVEKVDDDGWVFHIDNLFTDENGERGNGD